MKEEVRRVWTRSRGAIVSMGITTFSTTSEVVYMLAFFGTRFETSYDTVSVEKTGW